MRRLLWVLAWTGVAVWSLFCLAGYGIVDLFGGLASRHADVVSDHPETVEWISWFFAALRSFGTTMIGLIWAFVSLCILAVPWMFDRLGAPLHAIGAASWDTPAAPRHGFRSAGRPPEDGVVDLSPDQYADVRPEPDRTTRPGPVPRIDGRPGSSDIPQACAC